MIFNEIKCHVSTTSSLVGGMHPLHPPPCVRAWLPHQIFTRGKMNNAKKSLSSTYLQLRTKLYLQKTSLVVYIEISTFNNYQTLFFSNY